jgi:hypothetical protein
MKRCLPALLALVALASAARAEQQELLEFHGNVLFNDFVYRSVLQLPKDARPTIETARLVVKRIARFLHDAGYVLATVRAHVVEDRIHIDVQEGQLDKVIFLGSGAFETLRLKLELSLPQNVFNRPLLEQQLQQIAHRSQLTDFAFELVPVAGFNTALPQLDELEALQALPFVRPGRPYELHIFVQPTAWGTGLSPDVYIGGIEGVGIGAHYQGKQLLFLDDRWELRGRIGATTRTHLETGESRPVLTRVAAQTRWYAPPLIGEGFRPSFGGGIDLWSQQRADLNLDDYKQATLAVSLGARDVVAPQLSFSFLAGIERRILFDVSSVGVPSVQVQSAPAAQTRPYLQTTISLTLNPDELRRDRRWLTDLDVRLYGPSAADRPATLKLMLEHQRMWTLGWNELWVNAKGTLLSGDVLYADEQSIGAHLRGPFSSTVFARRLASVGFEFRYSLLRDLFKVGLFTDGVIFGDIDRNVPSGPETLRGAIDAGMGAHVLVFDEFQVDAYFGYGWLTDGRRDNGIAIAIRQAF